MAENFKRSWEDRETAVWGWCKCGNISKVAEDTGIPRRTLRDWQKSEWWPELEARVREEIRRTQLGKLTHLQEMVLEVIAERLEMGDEVVSRNGGLIRKKCSGRDAVVMFGILNDKANVLEGRPTSISSSVGGNVRKRIEDAGKALQEIGAETREAEEATKH